MPNGAATGRAIRATTPCSPMHMPSGGGRAEVRGDHGLGDRQRRCNRAVRQAVVVLESDDVLDHAHVHAWPRHRRSRHEAASLCPSSGSCATQAAALLTRPRASSVPLRRASKLARSRHRNARARCRNRPSHCRNGWSRWSGIRSPRPPPGLPLERSVHPGEPPARRLHRPHRADLDTVPVPQHLYGQAGRSLLDPPRRQAGRSPAPGQAKVPAPLPHAPASTGRGCANTPCRSNIDVSTRFARLTV